MSSKRAIRRRSCGNKKRYESKEQAYRSLIWMANHGLFFGKMGAYLCDFCHHWHVGHNDTKKGQIKIRGVSYGTALRGEVSAARI